MFEEFTRRGIELEARRRFSEEVRRYDRLCELLIGSFWSVVLIGGVALIMAYAHVKRQERAAREFADQAQCELMQVTGGRK